MTSSLSRAEFGRLSLLGLLAVACRDAERSASGAGQNASSAPTASAQPVATAVSSGPPASASPSAGVPKRMLGSTAERVSMIGLGGSHIGQKDKLSDDESIRLMRDAIEGGISFFDNCWDYNDGLSEERMGKALRDGYRKRGVLAQDLKIAREFQPLSADERRDLLARTALAAKDGAHELFKTASKYDGTAKNPRWLESARI